MTGLLNTSKVIEHHLYRYRPLFLDGSKDAKTCYRLVEEVFAESANQSTIAPELEKANLALSIGVTERTIERARKKLVSEGRLFYEHTSKGKGKYSLLFQETMQLPNDCLLDTKINDISLVVSNLATYNQPQKTEKIHIADIEALIASSSFSIAQSSSKNETQAAALEAADTNSIETITHQHNVKEADSKNFPISVEAVANTKKTNSPTLFYGEKEIESMIGNLTEDEQDSLIEEISSLIDDWTNTTDLQLKKDLVAEYKKSQQEISNNWYEDWLWDKAQVEIYRKYVIEFMEGRGYIYKAEDDLLENQQTPIVEVEVKPVLEANVSTSNPNNNNFELLGDIANKVLSASTITNTNQNVAIPIQAIQESGDRNVASASQENVTSTPDTATNESPVNNVANLTQNSTDQNVAVSVTTTESLFANRLPALEIGNLRQECRRFSNFSSCPGAITTPTSSHSLHACTHAYTRMREVKLIKLDKYNKYINFLTFLKNGYLSNNSATTNGTTHTSTSCTESNAIASIPVTTHNTSETPSITSTTSQPNKLADTLVEVDKIAKQICNTSKSTPANATNDINISSNGDKLTKRKQNTNTTKKAKGKPEEPTPEMIKRLKSDRVSPKEFSLWKIINKDHKIEQDNDGNYLLPNRLQNHPKSKHSFWDILSYAQTQKSVKAPVGFSISKYYSGEMDSNPTFQEYLKDKATSLIGAARKSTEPTAEQKLEAEKAKREYEELVAFDELQEKLWEDLTTDEKQHLLLEEIKELKANKNFLANYEKLRKDNDVLEQCAINNIKTRLAKEQIAKNSTVNISNGVTAIAM